MAHAPTAATRRPLSLTALILTFNEERHIERCVRSLQGVAERVCVVDSFSKDKTVEIARSLGAEVEQHAWRNYADQFQWGVDHFRIASDWLLRLDADEYLDTALIDRLHRRLPTLDPGVTGLTVRLKVIFQQRWIRFGGYGSTNLLRLWRPRSGRIEQRWMDEQIVLDVGRTEYLGGYLVNEDLRPFHHWIDKHNKYATRLMVDAINLEHGLFEVSRIVHSDNPQARRRRFLEDHVYRRLPMYLAPFLYYFYRYFVLLGFLDGRPGLVFHFNHALWYRVLESVKIAEARSFIAAHGKTAFREHIQQEYGLDL
jgi:glycosyltransferase involved in cell wall biosynthesis